MESAEPGDGGEEEEEDDRKPPAREDGDASSVPLSSSKSLTPREGGRGEKQPSDEEEGDGTASASFSRSSRKRKGKTNHEARWDQMFGRLVEYHKRFGNANVPNRYAEDPQLGSWVSSQRRAYKTITSGAGGSTAMTLERATKLKQLGFEWEAVNPNNVPWETRYNELLAFVKKYGHANVPMRWQENVQLSNWVSKQRHDFKLLQRGTSTRLTEKRKKLLNDVNFVWEVERGSSIAQLQRVAVVGLPSRRSRRNSSVSSEPATTPQAATSNIQSRSSPSSQQQSASQQDASEHPSTALGIVDDSAMALVDPPVTREANLSGTGVAALEDLVRQASDRSNQQTPLSLSPSAVSAIATTVQQNDPSAIQPASTAGAGGSDSSGLVVQPLPFGQAQGTAVGENASTIPTNPGTSTAPLLAWNPPPTNTTTTTTTTTIQQPMMVLPVVVLFPQQGQGTTNSAAPTAPSIGTPQVIALNSALQPISNNPSANALNALTSLLGANLFGGNTGLGGAAQVPPAAPNPFPAAPPPNAAPVLPTAVQPALPIAAPQPAPNLASLQAGLQALVSALKPVAQPQVPVPINPAPFAPPAAAPPVAPPPVVPQHAAAPLGNTANQFNLANFVNPGANPNPQVAAAAAAAVAAAAPNLVSSTNPFVAPAPTVAALPPPQPPPDAAGALAAMLGQLFGGVAPLASSMIQQQQQQPPPAAAPAAAAAVPPDAVQNLAAVLSLFVPGNTNTTTANSAFTTVPQQTNTESAGTAASASNTQQTNQEERNNEEGEEPPEKRFRTS